MAQLLGIYEKFLLTFHGCNYLLEFEIIHTSQRNLWWYFCIVIMYLDPLFVQCKMFKSYSNFWLNLNSCSTLNRFAHNTWWNGSIVVRYTTLVLYASNGTLLFASIISISSTITAVDTFDVKTHDFNLSPYDSFGALLKLIFGLFYRSRFAVEAKFRNWRHVYFTAYISCSLQCITKKMCIVRFNFRPHIWIDSGWFLTASWFANQKPEYISHFVRT